MYFAFCIPYFAFLHLVFWILYFTFLYLVFCILYLTFSILYFVFCNSGWISWKLWWVWGLLQMLTFAQVVFAFCNSEWRSWKQKLTFAQVHNQLINCCRRSCCCCKAEKRKASFYFLFLLVIGFSDEENWSKTETERILKVGEENKILILSRLRNWAGRAK